MRLHPTKLLIRSYDILGILGYHQGRLMTYLLCDDFSFTTGPEFNYNKLASLCIGYALGSHAFVAFVEMLNSGVGGL